MRTDQDNIIIDGDVLVYRAAWSKNDDTQEAAIEKVDELLCNVIDKLLPNPPETGNIYTLYLTGKGNFREAIGITAPYKGNRKDVPKPIHIQAIRDHLVSYWEAEVSSGEEADDCIGIKATEVGEGSIVVSIDKDMLQIPCYHYNPTKYTLTKVTKWQGTQFFYEQVLTGDKVDNIIGLMGVGPVKAKKALEKCKTEGQLFQVCIKMYNGNVARVIENARLLWLRRTPNEIWEPPKV